MAGYVDPREVEEMARLRRILAGENVEEVVKSVVTESAIVGESTDPKDDMKRILQMFNQGMSESIERVADDPSSHPEIKHALVTEKTASGVKVGSWEIKVYEDNGNKTFDVCHVQTAEPIARDLTLYESALAITKMLNKHVSINSKQIRELLDLEDQYARSRQEAALFKRKSRRMNESGNLFEAHVADDRYQESRATAIRYRDKIVSICKTL